jgi:hypothetical protein
VPTARRGPSGQRAAVLGISAVLAMTAPTPAAAWQGLRQVGAGADPIRPLVDLCALTGWTVAGWLLVAAALTTAGRLPGSPGRLAAAVSRRVTPRVLRRVVEAALGATVAVGALGPASPAAAAAAPPAAAASVAVTRAWPAGPTVSADLDWPSTPVLSAASADLDWPSTPVPSAASIPAPAAGPGAAVVVRRGDTLWGVAAEHLPAQAAPGQIAQAWPTWWAANRVAIGADPGLIHPGLRLTPPAQP